MNAAHFLKRTARVLAWSIFAAFLFAICGSIFQVVATQRDSDRHPPPGHLIDVGGYRLHLYCSGQGVPTVVLDTMADGTSVNWAWVQPEIAKTTRVCAYDRGGRGWSDSGPEPRDGLHLAQELRSLLAKDGVEPPYVLVGHSFGAFVTRIYAGTFPEEVAGMVIIDGGQPDIRSPRFPEEGRKQQANDQVIISIAPILARLGVLRLLGSPPELPPSRKDEFLAHYASTKLWDSLQAESAALSATDEQVRSTGSVGDRPLMIVNANRPADEVLRVNNEMQTELLAMSSNSIRKVIDGATHASLVFNQQHALETSAEILKVVEAVRTDTLLAPPK